MATPLLPCPVAIACESCGDGGDLAVYEADTTVGTVCLTLCADCADADRVPRLSCADAVHQALTHSYHLTTDPALNGVFA